MLLTNIYTAAFAALLVIGFFFRKNEDCSASKIVDLCFCIAVAFMASTFFSVFPLTKTYTYTDSSVFIYIGKMMQRGYVPYRDLFDHKGILLYVIQFLGSIMTPESLTGIWLIEVAHMIFTTCMLFKIAGLFTEDRSVKYISVIAVVIMCGMNTYEGGNFTEEYALPWISLALYIFLKYFINFEYQFKEIIWLGIGFGVVALLRVNMAVIWAVMMPIVLAVMLWKRQWKTIGNCAMGFCLGLILVFVPVCVYLLCTGSFQDFIQCYITFNFGYSDGGSNWAGVSSAIVKGLRNLPYAVAAIVLSLWPHIKNRLYVLNLLILTVSLYFAHMSGRYYQHYGIILLPMFVVVFVCALSNLYEILSVRGRIGFKMKFPGMFIMILGLVLAVVAVFFLQYKWANLIREPMMQAGGVSQLTEYIKDNSAEEEDVLIVGNDSKYYLLADRYTKNKYFYQTPPIKISDEIYEEFMEELEKCNSKLIVVMGDKETCMERDDNLGAVYQYLEEQSVSGRYCCETFEDFYVYKRVVKE